ncbi:hypothetical protein I7860_16980 [Pseudomonas tolaasii]|uniref:hypothetical protein n=1 Tax=Pseudomonas tolaasii TaxID=29442 RepID=UPI001C58FA36|nr:hypothetical protein [Pseudomonas tolaasii]MBW1248381.1 hypothetical protein [Pseudomonas tolaasii]
MATKRVAITMTLERFQAFGFRASACMLRSNLGKVATNELVKVDAFCLDKIDKKYPCRLRFRYASPGLGVGFGFEGFALGWGSLYRGLSLPIDTRSDS